MNNHRFLFTFLILLNISIFLYGSITHFRITIGESIIYSLSRPILQLNKFIVSLGNEFLDSIKTRKKLKEEVKELKKENLILKNKLNSLKYIIYENSNLKKLLNYAPNISYKKILAKVIGGSNSLYQNILIINKGANDNIQEGMGVVGYEGVVGIVVRSFSTTSKVLMITDPRFKLDVKLLASQQSGILSGDNKICIVKYLPLHKNCKLNELVITSGYNSIFPYGIPVGYVIKIKKNNIYKEAVIKPFIKKTNLDFVFILVKK